MSDALVEVVRAEWSWTGIDPEAVTAVSPFGHLILRDRTGVFWYLDPELCTLDVVAHSDAELTSFATDPAMREVWAAEALVEVAQAACGAPGTGRCYGLKIPALLGGSYAPDNLCTYPVIELVGFAGSLALQTRDLPGGTQVSLKIVD